MNYFYFAYTNPEAMGFLKKEVSIFYKELKLAYSTKNFISFKSNVKLKTPFNPTFAHLSGMVVEKEASDTIVLKINEKSFWGKVQNSSRLDFAPYQISPGILPKESPSRAYLKYEEISRLLELNWSNQKILELGSAPGGGSYYFTQSNAKLWAVDPGKMQFQHPNLVFINQSLEWLDLGLVSPKIDWIICDINLPPTVVLREIKKITAKLKPRCGLMITLKFTNLKFVESLNRFKNYFDQSGTLIYLPSLKKELILVVMNLD